MPIRIKLALAAALVFSIACGACTYAYLDASARVVCASR